MDVRYAHQREHVGAGVHLDDCLHVVEAVQIGQMRITAVMAAQAVLVNDRSYLRFVRRLPAPS
jgi:hypothetical protein